jgi:hypothetical protein
LLPECDMKTALLCGLILVSATSTNQHDISGRWVVSQDRDFRWNRGKPADCAFTQRHEALTVRCSAAGRMTGQVHGMSVTWSVDVTDLPPNARDHLTLTYSGALNGRRDTIAGNWTLKSQLSGVDESGTFEAKRKP